MSELKQRLQECIDNSKNETEKTQLKILLESFKFSNRKEQRDFIIANAKYFLPDHKELIKELIDNQVESEIPSSCKIL